MPIMKPKRFKSCLFEICIDCKMFVNRSVPHIEKMKLPNVNRKSNYHIYIHKSTNKIFRLYNQTYSYAIKCVCKEARALQLL